MTPVQLPPAVQDVGELLTLQTKLAFPLGAIEVGATDSETTGTAITLRVADAEPVPALFEQAKLYT